MKKELLNEAIHLLRISQSVECPQWVFGIGDCKYHECTFCRIEKCIDDIERYICEKS